MKIDFSERERDGINQDWLFYVRRLITATCTEKKKMHTQKNCTNMNDTFKRVVEILLNWHISIGILSKTTRYPHQISVEMFQFTRTPMTHLNVSFMLLNFYQCTQRNFVCAGSKSLKLAIGILINWHVYGRVFLTRKTGYPFRNYFFGKLSVLVLVVARTNFLRCKKKRTCIRYLPMCLINAIINSCRGSRPRYS